MLGGPLEGTPNVLLIMRATDGEAMRARLAGDPWTPDDLLLNYRVAPWTLHLGALT